MDKMLEVGERKIDGIIGRWVIRNKRQIKEKAVTYKKKALRQNRKNITKSFLS